MYQKFLLEKMYQQFFSLYHFFIFLNSQFYPPQSHCHNSTYFGPNPQLHRILLQEWSCLTSVLPYLWARCSWIRWFGPLTMYWAQKVIFLEKCLRYFKFYYMKLFFFYISIIWNLETNMIINVISAYDRILELPFFVLFCFFVCLFVCLLREFQHVAFSTDNNSLSSN